jgi:tetratricopeptide (TPR) repeat protein
MMREWLMREGRRARRCPWFTVGLCSLVLTLAGSASAQSTADELAHTHFQSGAAYLEQGDYDSSLREFQAAYDLSKRPEILINVATVNERLGHLEEAVAALDRYLAEDPNGENAETVKLRVENLRKRVAQKKAEAPPPTETKPAPVAAAPPPGPKEPPPHVGASKTPAYILFAAGGGLAVGSIVTGILASNEHSKAKSSCSPNCSDADLSTGRTLAVTSTVLTGAAVVATTIGAVLFFGGGTEPAEPGKPTAFVGITPSGVAAGTSWRFW